MKKYREHLEKYFKDHKVVDTVYLKTTTMPARISSLRDLDRYEGYSNTNNEGGNNASATHSSKLQVLHIPGLEDADVAQRLMNRIHNEFYPIIQRRGYNVLSISEMCCCGDGLDQKRKRKGRIMGPNVHGYNQTHVRGGQKVHSIHLRLRDARNHNVLFDYEHVAGTMAHELAHCVHGNHSAAFYKLMDEIVEQHAVFIAKGIVADKQGFPMGSNQAHTLGGYGGTNSNNTRNAAAEAAQRRMQKAKWMPQGPQTLGGDRGFRSLLQAREAAGQAAEARRLKDEVWCQPCGESDIIELSSDSEEEEENEQDDRKPAAKNTSSGSNEENDRKPAAVVTGAECDTAENATQCGVATKGNAVDAKPAARPASVVTIDLTSTSDEDDDDDTAIAAPPARGRRKRPHQDAEATGAWSCSRCTFKNLPGTVVCGMCGKESPFALEKTKKVVGEIRNQDEIEHVKKAEVQQSVNEFGFNIYGNGKQATAKLPHLT